MKPTDVSSASRHDDTTRGANEGRASLIRYGQSALAKIPLSRCFGTLDISKLYFRTVIAFWLGMIAAFQAEAAEPRRASTCVRCVRIATWVSPQADLSQPMALEFPGRAGVTGPNDVAAVNEGPVFPRFRNQTLRQLAHISAGGDAISIKFSNLFGRTPLVLDRVTVAKSAGLSAVTHETARPVLFGGREGVTIAPGQEVMSDDIEIAVAPLTTLAVTTFMKDAEIQSGNFMRGNAYVGPGDLTRSTMIAGRPSALSAYFMTQVDVVRAVRLPVVVTFGDSITYGWGSTPDVYNDYPSKVSELLNTTSPMSVVNSGFPGSRWVHDYFGPSGISRFKRDVLDVPGVTHVVILLGINDIGVGFTRSRDTNDASQLADAKTVTATLQTAIDAAKRAELKVYVGTLMPWKGFSHYTSGTPADIPGGRREPYNGEQVRQDVNAFIRSNRSIDEVLDFDLMIKDSSDPLRQKPALTADRLHPNDSGYAEMAKMVFGSLVRR